MILKETGVEGLKKDLFHLDLIMDNLGFYRTWDYYSAHYDLRYTDPSTNQAYYLRVPAKAVQGKLESPTAVLELETPFIGRHLFPHGLDRESEMPAFVSENAMNTLATIKEKLTN
jgi:hypothetical protein